MDNIDDNRLRRFKAPISISAPDSDGEKMDIKSIDSLFSKMMAKGGVITYDHSDRIAGKMLKAWEDDNGEYWGEGYIYNVDDSDDEIWEQAKNKQLGFSVRGRGKKDGSNNLMLEEYWSTTLTDNPAIRKKISMVSVAKEAGGVDSGNATNSPRYSSKELSSGLITEFEHTPDPHEALKIAIDHLNEDPEYYTKLHSCVEKKEVGKPFAGYKDFDSCANDNKDKDNPEAYCADIHYKTTGKYPAEKEKGDEMTKKEMKKEVEKQEEPMPEEPAPAETSERSELAEIKEMLAKIIEALTPVEKEEEEEKPKEEPKEEETEKEEDEPKYSEEDMKKAVAKEVSKAMKKLEEKQEVSKSEVRPAQDKSNAEPKHMESLKKTYGI